MGWERGRGQERPGRELRRLWLGPASPGNWMLARLAKHAPTHPHLLAMAPPLTMLQVAGKANVCIFPDLNTGNNTYKAVQQSTGAIAIGPLMQASSTWAYGRSIVGGCWCCWAYADSRLGMQRAGTPRASQPAVLCLAPPRPLPACALLLCLTSGCTTPLPLRRAWPNR